MKKRGRPRRKAHTAFTLGDLKNAARILRFNAPKPPPCICGETDFWIYINGHGVLVAQCRRDGCKYRRHFNIYSHLWGPLPDYIDPDFPT